MPTLAHTTRENIRAIVAAYRAATGVTVGTVSKKFYGNADFLPLFFRREHSISIDKADAFIDAIRAAWPEEAEWPHLRAALIEPPKRR